MPNPYLRCFTPELADPRGGGGGTRDMRPLGSKFFHFHAVFGKIIALVGAPPRENPGSATDGHRIFEFLKNKTISLLAFMGSYVY